jgi:hypothetical protein
MLRSLSSTTLQRSLGICNSIYPASIYRFYSKEVIKGNSPALFKHASEVIRENDIVLLRHIHNPTSTPVLSDRLRAGNKIDLQRDSISHDDILGKGMSDLVSSKKRIKYRISEPTLAEYTDLSPRIVTPVSSPFRRCRYYSNRIAVDLLPRCEFNCVAPRPPSHSSQLKQHMPRSRPTRDIRSWDRAWSIDITPCKSHTCCEYSGTQLSRR